MVTAVGAASSILNLLAWWLRNFEAVDRALAALSAVQRMIFFCIRQTIPHTFSSMMVPSHAPMPMPARPFCSVNAPTAMRPPTSATKAGTASGRHNKMRQARRPGVQRLAEASVDVVEHRSGVDDDTDPKLALELGTYCGYSSLRIAR